MKHLTTVFILIAMVHTVYAQQPDSILTRPDFFGKSLDYEAGVGFEMLGTEKQVQAYRKFFPNTFVTSEEYLRYARDTFTYIRYDSIQHNVLTEGKLVPAFCCNRIDTVILFDPETYIESYYLIKSLNWSKEGLWKEQNNELYARGNYQRNQRTGEWYFWDENIKQGYFRTYNDKGQALSETPQNLLQINDVQKKKAALIGVWKLMPNIDASDEHVHLLRLTNPADAPYFNTYSFSADSVWFTYRSGKILRGIWTFSPDNVITIKGNDSFWAGDLEIIRFERNELMTQIRRKKEEKKEK